MVICHNHQKTKETKKNPKSYHPTPLFKTCNVVLLNKIKFTFLTSAYRAL